MAGAYETGRVTVGHRNTPLAGILPFSAWRPALNAYPPSLPSDSQGGDAIGRPTKKYPLSSGMAT